MFDKDYCHLWRRPSNNLRNQAIRGIWQYFSSYWFLKAFYFFPLISAAKFLKQYSRHDSTSVLFVDGNETCEPLNSIMSEKIFSMLWLKTALLQSVKQTDWQNMERINLRLYLIFHFLMQLPGTIKTFCGTVNDSIEKAMLGKLRACDFYRVYCVNFLVLHRRINLTKLTALLTITW